MNAQLLADFAAKGGIVSKIDRGTRLMSEGDMRYSRTLTKTEHVNFISCRALVAYEAELAAEAKKLAAR